METEKAVLAITADDDRFVAVREAAADLALREDAALILYDWDAAMLFGDPLPSVWSAEGTDTAVPDQLDVEDLEAAGRHAIAEQVREARGRGIVARAWLPSTNDVEALAQYAVDHGATTILLPASLPEVHTLESGLTGAAIRILVIGDLGESGPDDARTRGY